MAIPVGVRIPKKVSLGETSKWKESHANFKAGDGWTLKYYLANATADSKFDVGAETSGTNDFLITLNPTAFGDAVAGNYRYEAYVTKSTEKVRVSYGEIQLLADLTDSETTDLDYKTTARQIFEAIEATILGQASNPQLEMKIRDRSIKRYSPEELLQWYTFFGNIVAQEKVAENIEQGEASGNIIKVRFDRA